MSHRRRTSSMSCWFDLIRAWERKKPLLTTKSFWRNSHPWRYRGRSSECYATAEIALLTRIPGRSRTEAEPFAHALPELFPLFRGPGVATIFHAAPETGVARAAQSESTEKNAAQRQKAKRLPEGNLAPAEERRKQPIPEVQHQFAADKEEQEYSKNRQRSNEDKFPFHVQYLILS